jgi:hypothetical protein
MVRQTSAVSEGSYELARPQNGDETASSQTQRKTARQSEVNKKAAPESAAFE